MRHAFFSIQNFCIVCDTQYLSFKMFIMFVTQLYCTQHLTITFSYCSYIYKKVLSCIFKINKYIKNRNVIPVIIIEKCQMLSYHYQKKSYHYQIYHCLKVKPSFHEKLFQREKNTLLWIYARRLSGHLQFNGRWKSSVVGLNWNPCVDIKDRKERGANIIVS